MNETSNSMPPLLKRLQSLRGLSTPPAAMDYVESQKEYAEKANADIKKQQEESHNQRINNLAVKADLNPEWIFNKMIADNAMMNYGIATGISFANNFNSYMGSALIIFGDYGTGKSTLAGAIAHEIIRKKEKTVIFQQWNSIIDSVFFSRIENQDEKNEFRRNLETVDLLIIDEICANKSNLPENQASFLGHLLRRRKNLSKSVILISNLSPNQLQQGLGFFCFEAIKAFAPEKIELRGLSRRPDIINN